MPRGEKMDEIVDGSASNAARLGFPHGIHILARSQTGRGDKRKDAAFDQMRCLPCADTRNNAATGERAKGFREGMDVKPEATLIEAVHFA